MIYLGLIGAGNRGQGIFGQYALDMPHRVKFNMVVEPDKAKREFFAANHQIPAERCFSSLEELDKANLSGIDGVIIAALEDQRIEPLKVAMKYNWHILCEKPLCKNAEELRQIQKLTCNYDKIIIVCHQMRLTPVYKTIKELISCGRYGKVTCMQHSENLAYSHMAHSFVRGVFNNSRLTPMLLAKSCHDMDIITYLMGQEIKQVSSFGSLNYFTKANCPSGAPKFCLDGCPAGDKCPYNVLKLYFNDDTDQAYIRQMGVVKSKNQLRELLSKNQFGRCVFQCDNDVVDNQTVSIQMENGTTISFTMCGNNGVERRMTKISMTNGEIQYDAANPNEIKVWSFEPLREEVITVHSDGTHSGGDRAIMNNFADAIENNDKTHLLTPIKDSFKGHFLVFAAEASRHSGKTVNLKDFIENK